MPWTLHQYETARDTLIRRIQVAETQAAALLHRGHPSAAQQVYDRIALYEAALDRLEVQWDNQQARQTARQIRRVGYAFE